MSIKNIPTRSTLPSCSQNYIDPPATRRAIFSRKRQIDDCQNERQVNHFPATNSKEKVGLQKETSYDALKTKTLDNGWLGQIKYLSPHFTRSPSFTSPPQKKGNQLKQKFVRKQEAPRQTSKDRCSKKHQTQAPSISKLDSFNVQNSLESLLTKNSELTDIEGTARNWFSLEAENENLRQEKINLEKERNTLSQQLHNLHEFLKRQRISIPKTIKKPSPSYCNSCQQLSLEFQAKLEEKKSEYEIKERQLLSKFKQQQFQIDFLKEQLQLTSAKLQTQKQTTSELLEFIQVLKQECMTFKNKHEITAVKQDILMRKKAQFDNAQVLALKADNQRQKLRKTLGEYKKKMGRLNEMITKNKKQQQRLDQQLDYSLDLSTSFDYN